jgi:hypothetical protein
MVLTVLAGSLQSRSAAEEEAGHEGHRADVEGEAVVEGEGLAAGAVEDEAVRPEASRAVAAEEVVGEARPGAVVGGGAVRLYPFLCDSSYFGLDSHGGLCYRYPGSPLRGVRPARYKKKERWH